MAATTGPLEASAEWTKRRGRAPGLEGLAGRLRLEVGDEVFGDLSIRDGAVEIVPDADAPATLVTNDERTMLQLLGGELHPIVASLQKRGRVEGDVRFSLRVLLGLQAGSPWTGVAPRS